MAFHPGTDLQIPVSLGKYPLYLSDLLHSHTSCRFLGSVSRFLLDVPRLSDCKTKRYGQLPFTYGRRSDTASYPSPMEDEAIRPATLHLWKTKRYGQLPFTYGRRSDTASYPSPMSLRPSALSSLGVRRTRTPFSLSGLL